MKRAIIRRGPKAPPRAPAEASNAAQKRSFKLGPDLERLRELTEEKRTAWAAVPRASAPAIAAPFPPAEGASQLFSFWPELPIFETARGC